MLLVLSQRVQLRAQTKHITMLCARTKLPASPCHPCAQVYHYLLSTADSPVTHPLSLSLSLVPGITLPKSASPMPQSKHSKQLVSLAFAQ